MVCSDWRHCPIRLWLLLIKGLTYAGHAARPRTRNAEQNPKACIPSRQLSDPSMSVFDPVRDMQDVLQQAHFPRTIKFGHREGQFATILMLVELVRKDALKS
jgi:hypothetical protein